MIIQFEKRERIALITLNRPEARNAVNHEVAEGIEKALDEFENDENLTDMDAVSGAMRDLFDD